MANLHPAAFVYPQRSRVALLAAQSSPALAQSPSPSPTPPTIRVQPLSADANAKPSPRRQRRRLHQFRLQAPHRHQARTPPPALFPVRAPARSTIWPEQRFNQMITNRVLGNVLLGVNEQVNCNDCVSAFGSAGSFSAGVHGRKNLTAQSVAAGRHRLHPVQSKAATTSPARRSARSRCAMISSTGDRRGRSSISAPSCRRSRKCATRAADTTSLGAVSLEASTTSENYAVYGRAGWMSRLSPRDEVAASVEVWQLWQRVKGYTDPAAAFNPFDASIATGTDRTNLVKVGGTMDAPVRLERRSQYQRRMGEILRIALRHRRERDRRRYHRSDNRQPGLVRIWRPARLPHHQGLGRRPLPQRHRQPQPVGNTLHGGVGLRIAY